MYFMHGHQGGASWLLNNVTFWKRNKQHRWCKYYWKNASLFWIEK